MSMDPQAPQADMAPQAAPQTAMLPVDPLQGVNEMLRAIETLAGKANVASSAAEAKDFAGAALAFAQTIITLDPSRLAGGDTPEGRKASMPDPQQPTKLPPTKDGDHDGQVGA